MEIESLKVKLSSCILSQCKAGYWQLTPFLLYIAVVLHHTRSWSDLLHPLQHEHTHYILGSRNLQSPYTDTDWFDLKERCGEKLEDYKLQILYNTMVLTFNIPTVASFPNVTFGAACCAALWPSAGAVFYYHVVLPNTLQCMHFAHIQKNWFSTHSSSTRGAHIQRWTAYKKNKKKTHYQTQ